MISKYKTLVAFIIVQSLLLSACVPAVVGGAAASTAWVAQDKRTTGTIIDDQTIELKIQQEMDEYEFLNLNANAHINIISYNNIVLLVGQVPSSGAKEKIGEIARDTQEVRKVYNELEVQSPSSLMTRTSDSWITTKIKTSSGFKKINPLHSKVVTENGVVYLMGIVTREQAEQLTELARTTSGVQRVVRVFEYVD